MANGVKRAAKFVAMLVDCECGHQHNLPFGSVIQYGSQGCDSCGYGATVEYSWTCPETNRMVSCKVEASY